MPRIAAANKRVDVCFSMVNFGMNPLIVADLRF